MPYFPALSHLQFCLRVIDLYLVSSFSYFASDAGICFPLLSSNASRHLFFVPPPRISFTRSSDTSIRRLRRLGTPRQPRLPRGLRALPPSRLHPHRFRRRLGCFDLRPTQCNRAVLRRERSRRAKVCDLRDIAAGSFAVP